MKGRRYLVATYRKLNFLTTFRGARNSITRPGVRRGIILALYNARFRLDPPRNGNTHRYRPRLISISEARGIRERARTGLTLFFFSGELRNFKVRGGGENAHWTELTRRFIGNFFKKPLDLCPTSVDPRRELFRRLCVCVCVCALVWVYRGKQ